ncbi:MAG: hypothetical protein ABFS32_00640 [Bacteroidota bacterium]
MAVLSLSHTPVFSQEDEHHEEHKHHRIAGIMSHTYIPKGYNSTENSSFLIVPSWGFNYEYWFNEKWAIGLHNDIEISTYIIETPEGSELERERPFITSLVGIYKPVKGLEIIAGFGKEFENHESFLVYRIGLEYEIEISHHWDLAPGLVFDIKEETYNSWTLGIGIGRKF